MTNTFEFTLKSGAEVKLVAEYKVVMTDDVVDLDGFTHTLGQKPAEIACLEFYVNGKQQSVCHDSSFWLLTDTTVNGVSHKKIKGLPLAFADNTIAENYEKWINGIIEAAKPQEVKDYEAAQAEKHAEEQIAWAQNIIAKAEKQDDIPDYKEAKRRQKAWNDTYNEGGEGYVPEIIHREIYDYAIETLAKYAQA